MSEWILANDRLPQEKELVCITAKMEWKDDNGELHHEIFIAAGHYNNDDGWTYHDCNSEYWDDGENVIAWMPLPKPYEEDTDDE